MTSKFSEGVLEAVEWQQQRQKWQCYKTRPCSSICSSDATTCMQSFKLRGRRVHISPLNYPKCAQILGVCTHLNFAYFKIAYLRPLMLHKHKSYCKLLMVRLLVLKFWIALNKWWSAATMHPSNDENIFWKVKGYKKQDKCATENKMNAAIAISQWTLVTPFSKAVHL